MLVLVILGIVIAIVAILFAFQNATIIAISFGVWKFEESLAIILLITLGLGIIISLLLSIPTFVRKEWQTSRQKKKILALEAELQSRDLKIRKREEKSKKYAQKTLELLQAFELNDSVTGLLKQDSAVRLTSYLLQQVNTLLGNPRYNSLCIFLFSIEPAKSNQSLTLEKQENAIYRAISNRLKNAVPADSFLGITNEKRFICLCLGTMEQGATEYGKYLIERLTESPLEKADGTTMPLKVYIGGAIAHPGNTIDSHSILKQAEQNLEKAREQKRNSIVVTEATAVG